MTPWKEPAKTFNFFPQNAKVSKAQSISHKSTSSQLAGERKYTATSFPVWKMPGPRCTWRNFWILLTRFCTVHKISIRQMNGRMYDVLQCLTPKNYSQFPKMMKLWENNVRLASSPSYLNELLHENTATGSLRSATVPILFIPCTRTALAERAFSAFASRSWNSLPS